MLAREGGFPGTLRLMLMRAGDPVIGRGVDLDLCIPGIHGEPLLGKRPVRDPVAGRKTNHYSRGHSNSHDGVCEYGQEARSESADDCVGHVYTGHQPH